MKTVRVLVSLCVFAASSAWGDHTWDQKRLEGFLLYDCTPQDYFPEGEPPYVPIRLRDSLPQFGSFFSKGGWTTNQVIEGLMLAATNNMTDVNWANEDKRTIAGRAIWKLSEINRPAVTNFFRILNDDTGGRYKIWPVESMFVYTNLEPEIMDYMRSLCVRTNVYHHSATTRVMYNMFETLSTMPDALKPAATNRVAKYMYFSIRHTMRHVAWQDEELARFIPAYSNSLQRLQAVRYVESTTSNAKTRAIVCQEADRLSAMPPSQLNDIPWIAEP